MGPQFPLARSRAPSKQPTTTTETWAIRDAVNFVYNGDPIPGPYTENHDEVANGRSRVPETIWPGNAGSYFSRKRSTLGGALVMTAPGVPMIFQGQEFLEDEYFRDSDALDWSKKDTYRGVFDLHRDPITLRRNLNGNSRGLTGPNINFFHVNNSDKLIGFHRAQDGGPGDDVVVVMNSETKRGTITALASARRMEGDLQLRQHQLRRRLQQPSGLRHQHRCHPV